MKQNNKKIVHYDKEADVLAFYLHKGPEEEFVEVAPNVNVELDKKGNVVGIEILNASRVLRPALKSLIGKSPVYAR